MDIVLSIYRFIYSFWKKRLIARRDRLFPCGALCYYKGSLVKIAYDEACPIDKIPVLFENGNVWFKNYEDLKRVPPIDYQ